MLSFLYTIIDLVSRIKVNTSTVEIKAYASLYQHAFLKHDASGK